MPTELSRGGFSKCRFARDGSLDFFTAVNVGGVGWLLRWRQDELGELVLRSRAKVGVGDKARVRLTVRLGCGSASPLCSLYTLATCKAILTDRTRRTFIRLCVVERLSWGKPRADL